MESKKRPVGRITHIEELQRDKRRKSLQKQVLLVTVFTALALLLLTVRGGVMTSLGDCVDSLGIWMNRSGGYPVETGVEAPLQLEAISGSYVLLDSAALQVYSNSGSLLRSIPHRYSRPAVSCGSARFCLYERGGRNLSIESRTRTLYSQKCENDILLCQMGDRGSMAVVTKSGRSQTNLKVYDSSFAEKLNWLTAESDGTPVQAAFSPSENWLAVDCVTVNEGQIGSSLYLLNLRTLEKSLLTSTNNGSVLLKMEWLSNRRLLCVYSDSVRILDTSTGSEAALWDLQGATVQSVSHSTGSTALLLSAHAGSRLVVLNDRLELVGELELQAARKVVCTRSNAYILKDSGVDCVSLKGELLWTKNIETRLRDILEAGSMLVFTDRSITRLQKPQE